MKRENHNKEEIEHTDDKIVQVIKELIIEIKRLKRRIRHLTNDQGSSSDRKDLIFAI